jgi:ankyrin repeat protein
MVISGSCELRILRTEERGSKLATMAMSDADFFDLIQHKDVAGALAFLAERPALASARDAYLGSTPLHFAAHRGLTEVVAALLAVGADVHAFETVSQTTALHWAAEGGHLAIVDLLLARGGSLEVHDEWHRLTPLGWATVVDWAPQYRDDRVGTVKRLLAAGAAIDPFTAIALGRLTELGALVAGDAAALAQRLGYVAWEMTPLHVAAATNQTGAARLLLELGADPSARTSTGLTPLAIARQRGHDATATLLSETGASSDLSAAVTAGDLAEATACLLDTTRPPVDALSQLLFVATERQDAGMVGALLEAGANPDFEIRHLAGERPAMLTPLHFAARAGCVDVARILLTAGANLNAGRDAGVPTPLHFAAGEGHVDTVRALLASGTDRSARDAAYHATAAGWAEFAGHAGIAALLIE